MRKAVFTYTPKTRNNPQQIRTQENQLTTQTFCQMSLPPSERLGRAGFSGIGGKLLNVKSPFRGLGYPIPASSASVPSTRLRPPRPAS